MKHCSLTNAVLHLPGGKTLDVMVEILEIQKASSSVTVWDKRNAIDVNKSDILLRTAHSIEDKVTRALQNMIASSKMTV